MATTGGPKMVTDGLILALDASSKRSYPGSGTSWTDLSGKGHTGTLTAGPSYLSEDNGVMDFDGSDDIIELGNQSLLRPTEITQEAFINADSFSSWAGIISNMPSWGTGFSLQIGTSQKISAMVSGAYLKSTTTPVVNTWYHIVATHDSSDNNTLYVNGISENTLSRAISYASEAITTVGVFYTSPSLHFDGKIATVRTYNRALTASEVLQNYNALKYRFI